MIPVIHLNNIPEKFDKHLVESSVPFVSLEPPLNQMFMIPNKMTCVLTQSFKELSHLRKKSFY